MSTFVVPAPVATFILAQSPAAGLRIPTANVGAPEAANRQLVYTPDLSAAELTLFNRLSAIGRSAVTGITLAEWTALEPDIAGLMTYQGLANPTLAQTAAAVKALSRVVRAIVRS